VGLTIGAPGARNGAGSPSVVSWSAPGPPRAVGRGYQWIGKRRADVRQLAEHDAANLYSLGGAEQKGAALAATRARMPRCCYNSGRATRKHSGQIGCAQLGRVEVPLIRPDSGEAEGCCSSCALISTRLRRS
jgi:hypothetical protein